MNSVTNRSQKVTGSFSDLYCQSLGPLGRSSSGLLGLAGVHTDSSAHCQCQQVLLGQAASAGDGLDPGHWSPGCAGPG